MGVMSSRTATAAIEARKKTLSLVAAEPPNEDGFIFGTLIIFIEVSPLHHGW
jgi:hypothetical protein